MTWVRTEDAMPLHEKILELSDGAFRLWVNGLHHANRSTTNGIIKKSLVASLNHHGRWTPKQIAAFVAELVGKLWIDEGDHYRIHDYEHHQAEAMKDRVERKRELDRERQRRRRDRDDAAQRAGLGMESQPMSRRDTARDHTTEHDGHTADTRCDPTVPSRPVPYVSPSGDTYSASSSEAPAKPPRAPRDLDPSDSDIAAAIVAEIPALARLDPKTQGVRKPIGTLRAWAKRRSSLDPLAEIRAVAKGANGDPWLAERGYPLAALAKHPDKYATKSRAAQKTTRFAGGMAPPTPAEEHEKAIAEYGGGKASAYVPL